MQEGAGLVLSDVRDEDLQQLGNTLTDEGHPVVTIHHDVTSEDDWAQMASAAEESFGGLHVLVNNAGILSMAGVVDLTREI